MKKMTTLFKVEYHTKGTPGIIHNEIRIENAWVFTEENVLATQKFDGTACLFQNGTLYKRYDAKPGRNIPFGAIPCQEPDPISGHHPHWVEVLPNKPEDKFFIEALSNTLDLVDGTYEMCGPKVGTNNEKLDNHLLLKHGSVVFDVPILSFEGIREILANNDIEGIVFHGSDGKMCKIRKSDFGLKRN